jgi:hypothetical protein
MKKTFKTPAWQRAEGKNKVNGGLNEKGRKSYEAQNPGSDLKAPSKKTRQQAQKIILCKNARV